MKLSVNLPEDDVSFLDEYARTRHIASRSAALHTAVQALQLSELADAYADAWDEWSADEQTAPWTSTIADGL